MKKIKIFISKLKIVCNGLICSLCYMIVLSRMLSCTAPIELETRNSEPVIVIYGIITDEDKHQKIRITESSPYFDEKTNNPVNDAAVKVTSSEGQTYNFRITEDGNYFSVDKFAGQQGITYNLTVDVDFNKDGKTETYCAETTLLPPVKADSIEIKQIDIMGFSHYSLNVYMQEPPETENYYIHKFFINDTISNDKLSRLTISDDQMYNGAYLSGVTITFFEDGTDPDVVKMTEDNDYVYYVIPGDVVKLQILNIEKGYFQFINDCSRERNGENPFFGGPPSNIKTNILGVAVGYFSSYCVSETSTVIPPKK